ncbi:MAG: NUDIX hydrolase [Candidatus Sigynarchaeota archaeon]
MGEEIDDIKNVIVIGLIKGSNRYKEQYLFVKESSGTMLFPGGKVKVNESLTGALYREIEEETGLRGSTAQLACIEHASVWKRDSRSPLKSMVLYFFEMNVLKFEGILNDRVAWMDRTRVEKTTTAIPYDNLLITRGLENIELGRPYIVPAGFKDTPADPNHVSIRIFCWKLDSSLISFNKL